MVLYNIQFINKIINDNSNNKLHKDVSNFLDNVLIDILKSRSNSHNYNENNNMLNSKYKYNKYKNTNQNSNINLNTRLKSYNTNNNTISNTNKYIDQDTTNSYRNTCNDNNIHATIDANTTSYLVNRLKEKNTKSEYELICLNIRKILNKITKQTYIKLKTEFISYYVSLTSYNLKSIERSEINRFIFDNLAYNNLLFSELYCDLLDSLIKNNEDFLNILNDNLKYFIEIFKNIKVPESIKLDDITLTNRNNDKYKSMCIFYINCFKKNLIHNNTIITSLLNIQNELLNRVKDENNKYYCEEITEFIELIFSNTIDIISNNNNNNNNLKIIYNNIKTISNINVKDTNFPSISNKILFKHLNILEKYSLN